MPHRPAWFLHEPQDTIAVVEKDAVPREFIPKMMKMYQQRLFPIKKLCTIYPVAEMAEAVLDMHNDEVIKPVLKW
jgi:aryl-alcohol dehydrogenase